MGRFVAGRELAMFQANDNCSDRSDRHEAALGRGLRSRPWTPVLASASVLNMEIGSQFKRICLVVAGLLVLLVLATLRPISYVQSRANSPSGSAHASSNKVALGRIANDTNESIEYRAVVEDPVDQAPVPP
jgi:hypothetical protein